MLPSQKAAVDRNMVELVAALKRNSPVLFSYMELRGVIGRDDRDYAESRVLETDRLISLFRTLQSKDSGWQHLLSYLREHSQSSLADKLQSDDFSEESELANGPAYKKFKRSSLKKFSLKLANYYKQNYANLPTMGESSYHVKDFWVPLQIDGRREDFMAADRVDHVELLNRLKSEEGGNVALIKGDPGMGKTTLAKKIAYDWAINYGSPDAQQFSLVLAVPLRSVGRSDRFDQLAIDYFISVLGERDIDKNELVLEINRLDSQLLVILDGLDEYWDFEQSPFKIVFAAQFKNTSGNSKVPLPMLTFKLIITSRPYACERVNDAFVPLRFVILPLDNIHLDQFVRHYCQTPKGIDKVIEYLTSKAQQVVKVPLILTFVCYLADSVEEIPTNMTSLYDSFIRQMLVRENRQEKLSELVDIKAWKDSNVVKATAKLSYHGCAADKFEYSMESVENCHVTNDSFICGFLLHKSDFAQQRLLADFPHRSIQEFFAALHCYHHMVTHRHQLVSDIYKLILRSENHESQIGRFFFGICSKEERFQQMINYLSPTLIPPGYEWFDMSAAINQFGANLIDCSSDENRLIGQRLFDKAFDIHEKIISSQNQYLPSSLPLKIDNLSAEFKEALQLDILSEGSLGLTNDWQLAESKKSVRLCVIRNEIQQLLDAKCDQIDTLIWGYAEVDWKTVLGHTKLLPPVQTLVLVASNSLLFTSVSIRVSYSHRPDGALTSFRFKFDNRDRDDLLATVQLNKLVDPIVDERNEDYRRNGSRHRQLSVTVSEQSITQSTLIFSSIRLSAL